MKNKPNFFLITGVSQTGGVGGGGPLLGNFSHIIPFFSPMASLIAIIFGSQVITINHEYD